MKHTEEENQSDHQLDIDEGNDGLRQERVKSLRSDSVQQGSSNTKKFECSSCISQDKNITKPLLNENL